MRLRLWAFIALTLLLAAATACSDSRISRGPAMTPVPTKTLRPTFTNTPVKPTLTPSLTAEVVLPAEAPAAEAPTAIPPTAVPAPPEPTATPTPPQAAFTVTSATLNVRGGPGTNYGVIGQIRQGQNFPITGKNAAGSWWQFEYNGRAGWVSGQLVRTVGAESVQVAANIPAPPAAAPRPAATPTPRPQAQQPAQPPAPSYAFAAAGTEPRPNSNPLISVWCRVLTRDRKGLVAGTIRVTRDGQPVSPDQAFTDIENRADPGLPSEYVYNGSCKVELPDVPGTYAAYLVQGGAQVSEPINFSSSGDTRIFILTWVQK